ncbi:MAG: hypothetical protein JHD15_12870 [Phenylobacterium sp.]|uniref:hypothetical protein n=1 Tax=Phenylobacterium sp. TaxID=1871053 RepID=UPI001A2EE2E2|nr:hypothetical protein [Phenylobacterium sp.]MBJ7411241.1 hypothetical protein [Phenylobacterium sp.]
MPTVRAETRWFRLPAAWIRDKGLRAFSAAPTRRGRSGAALKVLIAILARAENQRADSAGPLQGSAAVSYDELMELTDLSREMVAKGVAMLREQKVVTVRPDPRTRKSRYFVRDYGPKDGFGRLPKGRLFGAGSQSQMRTLYTLSIRNEADVNALKLLLMISALQDGKAQTTYTSYHLINATTGIPEAKVSAAFSVLFDRLLVRRRESPHPETNQPRIHYDLLGLFAGQDPGATTAA